MRNMMLAIASAVVLSGCTMSDAPPDIQIGTTIRGADPGCGDACPEESGCIPALVACYGCCVCDTCGGFYGCSCGSGPGSDSPGNVCNTCHGSVIPDPFTVWRTSPDGLYDENLWYEWHHWYFTR